MVSRQATCARSRRAATFVAVSAVVLLMQAGALEAQSWNPDLGDGRYKNPVLFADFSDPDVIRVGEVFYMTASSFNMVPALPILESRDLVNWQIVSYAIRRLPAA